MTNTLSILLDNYNAATLRAIAKYCGISTIRPTGSGQLSKANLILRMVPHLSQPKRIQQAYKSLGEVEQRILNCILQYSAPIATSAVKRELIRANLVKEREQDPKSYYYHHNDEANPAHRGFVFEDTLARITQAGLLFSKGEFLGTSTKQTWVPASTLVIPPEILKALPKPKPLLQSLVQWEPEEHFTGDPTHFLRELYLYWRAVRPKPIPLLKNGNPGKRALKEINTHLLYPANLDKVAKEDDSFHLAWLRRILMAQKLLNIKNNTLHAQNGKFWQKTIDQQVASILNIWLENRMLNDVPAKTQIPPNFPSARRVLITALRTLSDGWVDISHLITQMRRDNRNFLFARSRVEDQRIYYKHEVPRREQQLAQFDQIEESFVRTATHTVLRTLGIIELGLGEYNGSPIEVLRITQFGRNILQQKPARWLAVDAGSIVVQPSFQILAMGAVNISKLAQLDEIAERISVDPNVFEYRLTRDSVYSALQNDFTAAQITTFLTDQTGVPLPQNVQRSIQEWGTRHERIVFRTNVTLLQAATPALLAQLEQHDDTKRLLARSVGETLALVPKKRSHALTKKLIETGQLPAVGDTNVRSTDHAVTIAADGTATPIHAVPSLLLAGRLAKIAEPQGKSWRLTAKSVGAAAVDKPQTEALLVELRNLASGDVPETLIADVKRWGGYYGVASAETLTLIEFQDHATLAQISKNAALASLLTPFPAGDRALAIIAKGKIKEVKQVLTTLGVHVSGKLSRPKS